MYLKTLCVASLLLGAMAFLSDDAAGQPKRKQPVQATAQDYHFLAQAKTVHAQLLSFDDATKTISVRVDANEWVPNPDFKPNNNQYAQLVQHQVQLAKEQQRLAASKSPADAQGHMRQIANLQIVIGRDMARAGNVNPNNMPFKAIKHQKDFDLDLQEKVAYRKLTLGLEYDDTGNPKILSKDEIAKLKGTDSSKPGFKAKASDFHSGQYVFVHLGAPKKDSKLEGAAAKEDKEEKKGKDKNAMAAMERPSVKMLIIEKEGTVPMTTAKPELKK